MGAFLHALPGLIILLVLYSAQIPDRWWIPILIIYGVASIGYCFAYGFTSINIQITETAAYWEQKLHAHDVDSG